MVYGGDSFRPPPTYNYSFRSVDHAPKSYHARLSIVRYRKQNSLPETPLTVRTRNYL